MLTTWDELKEMDIRNNENIIEDNNKQIDSKQPENITDNNKQVDSKQSDNVYNTENDKETINNKQKVNDDSKLESNNDQVTDKENKTNNIDFLESFNQKFNKDYKDYDSIDKILKEYDSISSIKEQNKKYKNDLELLEKELEEKHEASNPEKIYGSKEGYLKHLIEEKGKQENYNPAVVSRIISNNLDNVHDLTLIMMDIENTSEKLTGKIDILKDMALEEIGVNVDQLKKEHLEKRKQILDDEDKDIGDFKYEDIRLTARQEGEMIKKGSLIKRKFNELKKVEPKEYKSYKETKEQRLADIQKQKEEILNEWLDRFDDFKDFKLSVKYIDTKGEENEYDFVDKDYNENLIDIIKEYIGNNNIKPTKENIHKLRLKLENNFWADKERRDKALRKMLEDAKSLIEEKTENKYENGKPISKEIAQDQKNEDDEVGQWLNKRNKSIDLNSIW